MLHQLERRFGRFAVPNLTAILIIGQIAAFVACQPNPAMMERLVVIPKLVLEGQVYRLVTFLILPPGLSFIWAFFAWYLFFLMGTALERYWGTFRYNLFLLIGWAATVGAAFVVPDQPVWNWFLEGTVMLAFAFLHPTFTLHIFLVLPVQIRWIAMFTWIMYGLRFIYGPWSEKLAVAAAVLNFFLFFGKDILHRLKHGHRHMKSQATRIPRKKPAYIHKCVVCGLTDADDRQMDFRYCSQCAGDQCYYSEHLKNHDHVTESPEEAAGE